MNKEYIEREAALKAMSQAIQDKTWSMDDFDVMMKMEDYVADLSAADVEPVRHGKWKVCCEEPSITPTSAGVSKFWFECSLCGRRESQKEPYCHCGADMRGVHKNV